METVHLVEAKKSGQKANLADCEHVEYVEKGPDPSAFHVFPVGDGFYYPCLGCGCKAPWVGTGALPCTNPYTAPQAIGAQLTRIETALNTIIELLRANAKQETP